MMLNLQSRKCLGILILMFLLLGWQRLDAATQHDFQTWLNSTTTAYIDKQSKNLKRLKFWLEGQERIGDNSSRFSQSLTRTGLGFLVKPNLSVWIGYAWIYTDAPFTVKCFSEDRVWEQLLWTSKMNGILFTSRTRLEQRFVANNTAKVAYRIRQLVKCSKPLEHSPKFSYVTSEELFWHKNDFIGRNGQGFDQNRVFIGMGYQFNDKIMMEMGYMNQYIRRFGVPNFLTNILSMNVYMNF